VFFYTRKQEDLAGTDGLESMRKPFLDGSRLVVVLYRGGWGETPWTRVEQTAIQEGCLQHGWNRLLFIVLDKTCPTPAWLPTNCISLDYAHYGLEQAVGAIKARVQDNGGIIATLTALRRAGLFQQDGKYLEERRQISSYDGMAVVAAKVVELNHEIERLCSEILATGAIQIRVGSNAGRCVLTDNRVSLVVGWRQQYTNTIDGCSLKVLEYNAQMALPNERRMFFGEGPRQLREITFMPELSRAREYGWVQQGEPSQFLSSTALADRCVTQFLDLAARPDRGEVDPPSILRSRQTHGWQSSIAVSSGSIQSVKWGQFQLRTSKRRTTRTRKRSHGQTGTPSSPAVSGRPQIRLAFCTAWPAAPLPRLSTTPIAITKLRSGSAA
jgi:hypothetical protein